jgi:hypothetical protein
MGGRDTWRSAAISSSSVSGHQYESVDQTYRIPRLGHQERRRERFARKADQGRPQADHSDRKPASVVTRRIAKCMTDPQFPGCKAASRGMPSILAIATGRRAALNKRRTMEQRSREYPARMAAWVEIQNCLLTKSVACPKYFDDLQWVASRTAQSACVYFVQSPTQWGSRCAHPFSH